LALCALFVGVIQVLENAFALSTTSDYISVQSSGTWDRTAASELLPMNLQNI
jgi:hypothetical protein